ncbi:MAG: prolipoprotein diacylglyceryl transferase [Anaerolineae bacterium]
MYPILLRIGNLTIYSYTVLVDIGLIGGLALVLWQGRRRALEMDGLIDAAFYTIIAGVIGARAHYVLLNWAYFWEKPVEALYLWRGGLALHGALLFGGLALLSYASWKKLSFWLLADSASFGLALGGIFGWVGCLLSGCAYGKVMRSFLSFNLPDVYGITAPRFPTQVVGAVWHVIILALLFFISYRAGARLFRQPGLTFALYLLLYCAGDFALQFARADETLYLGPLRVAHILNALGFLLTLGLMVYLWRKKEERAESQQELSV